MRKKNIFLLLVAVLVSLPFFAAENEIFLRKKPGHETGSRTSTTVTASIDGNLLNVSFSDLTASNIVVYEATNPDAMLFNQNYAPAYSAQANLSYLPSGDYVVEIYAFDEWWIGEFEIE
ncbi:MAG: DUF3244 domain-containing protein [Bacteroidaceae bacterium]|nr:DUF3244 domain-containing protein [Bacteroidaceae bacterium]